MSPALALAALTAAAASWVLAARILYGRWNDRIRIHTTCHCGSRCGRCLMAPPWVMALAMAAGLAWPLMAVAGFAQWRQHATTTQRMILLAAERQRITAATAAADTERQRFEEATSRMRAARTAWITAAEIDTGLVELEDKPA